MKQIAFDLPLTLVFIHKFWYLMDSVLLSCRRYNSWPQLETVQTS